MTIRQLRIVVSPREFDVMIAALRLWQQSEPNVDLLELAEEHGDALDNSEIDALIERLNCGGL